jgi:ATP-dependent RNA helicase DeaD
MQLISQPDGAAPTFASLGLGELMMRAIKRVGYTHPTPIQREFIPVAIKGVDCTGQARTGTGKTAAFVIPILEQIDHSLPQIQALVLSPTRELSEQVAAEARKLAGDHGCDPVLLVGGRPLGPQIQALKRHTTIVVGTPGRVIDLMQRGDLILGTVKIVVLDEADRMLDIGFRPDIERILRRCPTERQTLLLSATMSESVERLAKRYMRDPQRIDLSKDGIGNQIEQFYCTVDRDKKFGLLVKLLQAEKPQQAIVFCRTKRGADEIYNRLRRRLPDIGAMHGDLQQSMRDKVMKRLRSGELRLMIATDVVGRGIDVSGISHIINYDLPEDCDDYVHRVGRTGRISSEHAGRAFSFVAQEEGEHLTKIEMRIDRLLEEYQFPGYDAYSSRPRKPHVIEDLETPFVPVHDNQAWDDIEI